MLLFIRADNHVSQCLSNVNVDLMMSDETDEGMEAYRHRGSLAISREMCLCIEQSPHRVSLVARLLPCSVNSRIGTSSSKQVGLLTCSFPYVLNLSWSHREFCTPNPSPLLQCVYSIYKQPVLCELGTLLEQGALPEVSTLARVLSWNVLI